MGELTGGAYVYAESPKSRICVMFKAALRFYYTKHPTHRYLGLEPSLGFFETFMNATIDLELAMVELNSRVNQNDAEVQKLQDRIARDKKEIEQQLNMRNFSL